MSNIDSHFSLGHTLVAYAAIFKVQMLTPLKIRGRWLTLTEKYRATLLAPSIMRRLAPVWYENLCGVVSCPENSNINTDGLYSVVIGSRDQ